MEIWLGRIKIPNKMTFLVLVLDLKTLASHSNRLPLDPELWNQEICSSAVLPVRSVAGSQASFTLSGTFCLSSGI